MATPKEPTRHERLGAAVVATILQSNARFIDNGLSKCANPIVDYELDLPDDERAGLEISRITDGGLLNMSASAAKLDWRTKTRYLWYLGVANRPRRLPDLCKECDDLPSLLERHDVLMFSNTVLPEGEARGAAQRLLDLGVITAKTNGDCNEQRVKVHPSWPSRGHDPGKDINNRVSTEAQANEKSFSRTIEHKDIYFYGLTILSSASQLHSWTTWHGFTLTHHPIFRQVSPLYD